MQKPRTWEGAGLHLQSMERDLSGSYLKFIAAKVGKGWCESDLAVASDARSNPVVRTKQIDNAKRVRILPFAPALH